MIFCVKHAFLATIGLCGLGRAGGQLLYQANPSIEWETRVQSIRGGNGVFLSTDDDVLVSSSNLGYVNAFDADDGAELWSYVPVTGDNEFLSSKSGITFITTDSLEYMVVSVIANELSLNPMT
jgi:outer membrane protein assembly factor BamB